MTFQHPLRVGSTEYENPEAVWEVLVEVEFAREMSVAAVEALQEQLWERLEALVSEVLGPHLQGSPGVQVYDIRGRGEETPLFPLVAGDARFTCNLDIVELVETRCAGTALREMAFDARGRAYDLTAQIEYIRRPEHDGERAAEIGRHRG